MEHRIKIQLPFAAAIMEGSKRFEVRENDRGYQKGDYISFVCYEDLTPITYPINEKLYQINYVLNGYGLKEGYCVFGFEEVL